MKKILILIIILSVPMLIISCSKKKITETDYSAVKENIDSLAPLIKESAQIIYENNYEPAQVKEMISLSNKIFDNIKSTNSLNNKYKQIIIHNIRLDIFSQLMLMYTYEKTKTDYTKSIIDYVDFYISELADLEKNNIDILEFLENYSQNVYKDSDYVDDAFAVISLSSYIMEKPYFKSKTFENIVTDLALTMKVSYNEMAFNERIKFWKNVFKKERVSRDKNYETINSMINNYKHSKSVQYMKNSKKYFQLLITDKENIEQLNNDNNKKRDNKTELLERVVAELISERNSIIEGSCNNKHYLTESTVKECINFIENSKSKAEALSYIADNNTEKYYFIDNKICMTDINGIEIFYNNDSPVCSALKNKLEQFQ